METPDERHHGQRMHDALEDVCDRMLRSDTVPESGGTPATVIVTIDLDDLLARTGYGTSSDGTLIPTDQVLRMANQADIIPTVLTRTGAVLDLGRTRRIASPTRPSPCTPEMLDVLFPAVIEPRNGANDTTSCPGSTVAKRT